MTTDTEQNNVEALDALLEAERQALLQGDLVALTDMLPNKEALIESLTAQSQSDLPALLELDTKVRRNQLLLNGALEGIRDVAARMAALQRMRSGLETYGSDGKKKNYEVNTDHSVERRA